MRFEISMAVLGRAEARVARAAQFSTRNGRPKIIDRRQQILPARRPKKSQINRARRFFAQAVSASRKMSACDPRQTRCSRHPELLLLKVRAPARRFREIGR